MDKLKNNYQVYFIFLYSYTLSTLYLWGYWYSFNINILTYITLWDSVKFSAYPVLLTGCLVSFGALISNGKRREFKFLGQMNDYFFFAGMDNDEIAIQNKLNKLNLKFSKSIITVPRAKQLSGDLHEAQVKSEGMLLRAQRAIAAAVVSFLPQLRNNLTNTVKHTHSSQDTTTQELHRPHPATAAQRT